MATLTVQTVGRAGVNMDTTAVAAASGGDQFTNTGAEVVYIKNAGAGAITLTINFGTGGVVDGQSATNRTVNVPNGNAVLVGPFPVAFYNDANGFVQLRYSAVTSVTVNVEKTGT